MKKISSIILSILCLVVLFFSGCTYADNATLLSIQEKYNEITSKNGEIFNGDYMFITYSPNITLLSLDSNYPLYYNLRTSESVENCGAYGVLMQAINSTYLRNGALSIISNNEITKKAYKKNMFEALEKLQTNLKALNNNKKSLESIFKIEGDDYSDVVTKELTQYRFNNYIDSLNVCLGNLLDFNRNYNDALVENISPVISLDDLLYTNTSNLKITKDHNNKLINALNIYISNYLLTYSAKIKNNIGEDAELVNVLKTLTQLEIDLTTLTETVASNGKDPDILDVEKIDTYKVLRAMEQSVKDKELTYTNIMKTISQESDLALEKNALKVDFVENYRDGLVNYGNQLITYLQGIKTYLQSL